MKYRGCEGSWTDERVEMLSLLWKAGASASQIATKLGGVTRNAVIGKVHRLGLSGRPEAASPKGVKAVKRPAGGGRKAYRPPSLAKTAHPTLRCVEVVSDPVSFIDRTRDQCAFMLDGYDEPTCCGAAVKRSATGLRLSNCPAHEVLAHVEVQPRKLHYDATYGTGRSRLPPVSRKYMLPNEMREAA